MKRIITAGNTGTTGSHIGLSREADFLRRQNNRLIQKQKKLRTIKLKGIHLLFILTLISFIAFAIFKTAQFILTWEKLEITSFRLTDCPDAQLSDVKAILSRYGGNILTLNLEHLRTDLAAVPEIKDVVVSRSLPSTVEIGFIMREPVYQLEINGKYNVIDKEGIVLYREVDKRENLITVKDVPLEDRDRILPYFSQLESIREYIEYISYKEPYGIQLKLGNIDETFYPGEIDFDGKIDYYLKLRKKLFLNRDKIVNVDLRFKDRFYLEYESSTNPEGGKS
jgi:cell division septal protein FtsQ